MKPTRLYLIVCTYILYIIDNLLEIITVIVVKTFMYLGYTIVGIRIKTLISKRFHAIIHIPLYTDFALDFEILQVPVHAKNCIILF